MFIFRRGSDMAILLLYVDDVLRTASSTSLLDYLLAGLKAEFSMMDLEKLNYFLGISAVPTDRASFYINATVKRILRYLRGTLNYDLRIRGGFISSLLVYSDANWAGCPSTRRSTTSFYLFLGSTMVSWSSKMQATVSRSSAEAEYRVVAHSVAELDWLMSLLSELGVSFPSPPMVLCDNISTTYMTVNPMKHARTKHIEIDIHFLGERVVKGVLNVSYVPAHDQLAPLIVSIPYAPISASVTVQLRLRGDDRPPI
ncbi:transmembrane signal receptor [Lithospermum erythrorhizon]|uniref:Transmembrane signal receptor n=1 Tax=Lithospermum erythrorhizon TaxID=34254 RepID=A0AAV3RUL6_LITER